MNADGWISVAEQMPPSGKRVLLLFEPGGTFRERMVIGHWAPYMPADLGGPQWMPSKARKFRITHWMPLPEPPK